MGATGPLAAGVLVSVAAAFGCLVWAYAVNDNTVLNVVQNSHSAKPLLYKISGSWGNHEGSMVLWVLILALCGGAVAGFGGNLPSALQARVLAILALVAVGFLGFILGTSNPFDRVWPPPLEGQGLNPILQDPGLAFHPPLLYLGYVGFAVTYAFAVAALIEGRVDAAWGRWVRPWALAAWSFLTLGIALGSWWAYYELGWGGYWFWDPVENASLMPWLAGCALLHSAIVVEKREALKTWTVFLSLLAFGMSLLGTFLVRSGVLNSVHAFANDPERGTVILILLALYIGGGFLLFAWRAPGDAADRHLRADVARGRAGAEQPAALLHRRGGAGRHALPDVRRPRAGREILGRPALLQHRHPAAGRAAGRRHGLRPDAGLEAGEALPGAAAAVVGGAARPRRLRALSDAGGPADRPGAGLRRRRLDHRRLHRRYRRPHRAVLPARAPPGPAPAACPAPPGAAPPPMRAWA